MLLTIQIDDGLKFSVRFERRRPLERLGFETCVKVLEEIVDELPMARVDIEFPRMNGTE